MEIGTELDGCILVANKDVCNYLWKENNIVSETGRRLAGAEINLDLLPQDKNIRRSFEKYWKDYGPPWPAGRFGSVNPVYGAHPLPDEFYNIWYDAVEQTCFSGAQFVNPRNAGKDQHFYTSKKWFALDIEYRLGKLTSTQGVHPLYGDGAPFGRNGYVYDSEHHDYFYTNSAAFEKFKGKKIMIVGGGPSTNSVNWENVDYDYLWTCNQFNRNDKLKNTKIDLVSLAPLVDKELNNGEELEIYFKENPETLAIFPIDRSGFPVPPVLAFADKYTNQSCLYQTRYGSVIGTMNRLIVFALLVGASTVYFVGMDGRSEVEEDGNLLHAFDGDKPIPGWWKTYGNRFQVRQFVIFYDYIMSLKERLNFEFYNLGEGHKYNASTPMTQKLFPLTDELKERINYNDEWNLSRMSS